MSKHAQRRANTRAVLLVVLAVVAAVLRTPRWQRRLRDCLDDVARPDLVPLEHHTPTRHRAADDRTFWREVTTRARDVVRAADTRALWRLAMPDGWQHVRWAGWRRPADPVPWHTGTSIGSLTGVIGVVLAVLLTASLVGHVGTAPAPRPSLATKSFRDNHLAFTRHLLNVPAAKGTPASPPTRSRARHDTDRSASTNVPAAPKTSARKPAVPVSRDRDPVRVQPYVYLNSKHVPDVGAVMRRTGVTEFTLAFVLSNGGCHAVWDGGSRVGRNAGQVISAVRASGGDVVVSFGGWAGRKLGTHCRTATALATAYQRVIDMYRLRAIDVDIEYREFENARAQDRVLRALRIVAAANPRLTTIVTMPVTRDGLNRWGLRMVRRAAELRAPVDIWTVMPFVLGKPGANMAHMTIRAAQRTHAQLARHYPGRSAADVYRMLGISTMNGNTGAGETITQANFREIRAYVHRQGLGRFTFWAVNRDWPCPSRGSRPCSGVSQRPLQFTDIVNGVP